MGAVIYELHPTPGLSGGALVNIRRGESVHSGFSWRGCGRRAKATRYVAAFTFATGVPPPPRLLDIIMSRL